MEAALIDLEDLEHNVRDGLHLACLAGTWTALVAGFGGMRTREGALSFAPRLPDGIGRLSFAVAHAGSRIRVTIRSGSATYQLVAGQGPFKLVHHGRVLEVDPRQPLDCPIPAAAPVEPVHQPPGRAPQPRHPGRHLVTLAPPNSPAHPDGGTSA
jgi:alpha,alpha-trehalose phosphorylase